MSTLLITPRIFTFTPFGVIYSCSPTYALNSLGPRYLTECLLRPKSTCITRSRQEARLRSITPREARKEKTRNWAFLAVTPRLWNSLPSEICMAPLLGIFKGQLKTWLFRQAFPPATSWFILFSHLESLSIVMLLVLYFKWFILYVVSHPE